MYDQLSAIKRLCPELMEKTAARFEMLEVVALSSPVGRRALSCRLGMPERAARNEADQLRDMGLLTYAPGGMYLTDEGRALLEDMRQVFDSMLSGEMGHQLCEYLGVGRVLIVPGDQRALYRRAARYLAQTLKNGMTLAAMGGSTMAGVARQMEHNRELPDLLVLPARGGMGEDAEIQANTVSARIARALGARHRLLHWPDDMPVDLLPASAGGKIEEWTEGIRSADVLIYGIGQAEIMASRRGLTGDTMAYLRARGAVAETWGCYVADSGQVAHVATGLGVEAEDLLAIPQRIAVAGGAEKAVAVRAAARFTQPTALIIDQAVASELLALLSQGV